MVNASSFLVGAFVLLPLLVLAMLVAGLRHAVRASAAAGDPGVRRPAIVASVTALLWVGLTAAAARSGRLSFSTVPPTMMVAVLVGAVLALLLGLSPLGRRLALSLPLAALVGSQAFRLPLELSMHRAMSEGLMPAQMSYSGLNFDIVTGATALMLAIALLVRPIPIGWVRAWNVLGFLLLVNVVTIAVLSTPLFQVFDQGPANTWIASFPYVWLPTVLVPAALLGHVLVWRRLHADRDFPR